MKRTKSTGCIFAIGLMFTGHSAFGQITVEQDGSGDHTTITAAIAAASDGDTILIGAGTYPEGPISFLGKELTLDGVDPSTRIISSERDGDPVFVIDGGQEEMFNALENLTISGARSTGDGGGILLDQSSLHVINCTIEDNQTGTDLNGGGLCITNGSRCVVSSSRFVDNLASGGRGGGLYVSDDSEVWLRNTDFINNSAAVGGGACIDLAGDCTADRCVFAGNSATSGGGLSIGGNNKTAGLETPRVISCAFTGNTAGTGGAIRMVPYDDPDDFSIGGGGRIDNCTFSMNSALTAPVVQVAGAGVIDQASIRNGIIWMNSGSQGSVQDARPNFSHCQMDPAYLDEILENPFSSTLENVSSVDPRFLDELGPDDVAGTGDENLRVMPGSPAIDRGTTAVGLTSSDFDLAGNSRRIDDPATVDGAGSGTPPIDRGAYEFDPTQLDEQGFAVWAGGGTDTGILDEDNWFDGVVSDSTHTWVFDGNDEREEIATAESGQALIGGLTLGSGELSLKRSPPSSGVIRLKDGPSTSSSDYASLQVTPFAGETGTLCLETGLVADNVFVRNQGRLMMDTDSFIQVLGSGLVRIDGANSLVQAINLNESVTVSSDLLNLGKVQIKHNELVVTGDYMQSGTRLDGTEAKGSLEFLLLAPEGSSNRLTVTGQAQLSGNISFELGQQPVKAGDSFTVLTAESGLAGTSFDFAVTQDFTNQGLAFLLSTESALAGGSEDVVATAVNFSDLLSGTAAGNDTAGASVQDLIFADIDGDGFEDMILSVDNGVAAGAVAVLLNQGVTGGSWDEFESYGTWVFTVGIGPRGLDVGYINDDEALDVVVANYTDGTFTVLLNDSTVGSVSFTEPLGNPFDADSDKFAPSSLPVDVCVKNLDADPLNLSDVLVTNELDGSVWAFQNTSTFFSTSLGNEQESKPAKAIARFSPGRGGGGRDDDAVGSSESDDGTSSGKPSGELLSGSGITMVWTSYDTPPGSAPIDLATADFNGDGRIDVATINSGDATVSIFTDTGIGIYDPASTFSLPSGFTNPISISAGDLDADGDIDLSYIAENGGGQFATFTIQNTLAAPENVFGWVVGTVQDLAGQGPFLTRTSDVDNDGDDDVIALVTSSSLLASKSGAVPGFFTTEMTPVNPEKETCVGDYDGDGVVAGSDLATLLAAWGTEDAEIDLTGDALIDGADLATLLAAWGPCDDEESIVD